MPTMTIFAVAASSALAGAALVRLAAGKRLTAGGMSIMERGRAFRAATTDAVRSTNWARPRSAVPKDSAFEEYRAIVLARLEGEQRQLRDDLRRLRQANDKVEFDALIAERNRQRGDVSGVAPQ